MEFATGTFDNWCVYVNSPRRGRFAPTDLEYFSRFDYIGQQVGHSVIYQDFLEIYLPTTNSIDARILGTITDIAKKYGSYSLEMDVWFTVIYAGMVAEENKKHAVLKKRIKRLGMHQLLIDRESPAFAARFSRGKKVHELLPVLKAKGI